jgi:hypothetical protein
MATKQKPAGKKPAVQNSPSKGNEMPENQEIETAAGPASDEAVSFASAPESAATQEQSGMTEAKDEQPAAEAVIETPAEPVIQAPTEQSVGQGEETPVADKYAIALSAEAVKYLDMLQEQCPGIMSTFYSLFDYMSRFAPGKIVPPETIGGAHQFIYSMLRRIIRESGESYKLAIGCLLMVFAEHGETGALGMAYATRHAEHARMSDKDWHGYVHLLNLLREIGPAATRKKAIRSINLEKALNGLTDQEHNIMQEYLSTFA